MISEKAKELSSGLMEDSTSASGKQESNTESALTSVRTECKSKANGKTDAR